MTRKRTVILFLLAFASFLFNEQSTFACSCSAMKPPILDQYSWATYVIVVQAVSVDKDERRPGLIRSTKTIVERVFKGPVKPGEEMVFAQGGGGDCGWTFSEKDIGQR